MTHIDTKQWLLLAGLFFYNLAGFNATAQNPYYINYDIEEGLPSSESYDVHAAADGRIFITTDRGVSIYDGYTFNTYSTNDGLACNTNFQIFEDYQGRLWFNGWNATLSVFEEGQFRAFSGNAAIASLNTGNWISDLSFSPNGNVYFQALKDNVFSLRSFRPHADTFELENLTQSKQSIEIINTPQGTFYQQNNRAFLEGPPLKKLIPFYPFEQQWIGFRGTNIYILNREGQLLSQHQVANTVDAVFIDNQGDLWVCTFSGLLKYPKGDLTQKPTQYFESLSITNMCQDFEGNYWLSTLTNGVLLVPSFNVQVLEYPMNEPNTEKILTVHAMDHHITFGTSESRILALDRQFHPIWLKEKIVKGDQVRYAHRVGNELYFGLGAILKEHRDTTLALYSLFDTPAYQRWKQKTTYQKNLLLYDNNLTSFTKRLRNRDYFLLRGSTFIVWDEENLLSSAAFPQPFTQRINCVLEDTSNNIWLGTGNGIYQIPNNQYAAIQPAFVDPHQPLGRVEDLIQDRHQNFWIATIGQALFYQTAKQRYHIGPAEGLNSDHINTIYASNDSTLWAGTNKGLYQLTYYARPDSFRLINLQYFSTVDGLSSNYINDIAYWQDHLWLATNRGITYCRPSDLERNYPIIPVGLTQLVVNDEIQNSNQVLHFNHQENDIYLQYTGISYRKDKTAFYRFRLNVDGQIRDWFYTNERNVRYDNLPPGAYTFEVSAQNKVGIWSKTLPVARFIIHPHFSQTLWFRILLVSGSIGSILYLVYLQLKKIRHRTHQKQLLQQAQHRTREAELSALRNQMNPHFVFNSLNAIQHYIFKKDTLSANYFLAKFSRLMRDSLEFSRLEYIPLDEEIAFLKNYLELETLRFPDKFTYHFQIDVSLLPEAYLIPSLLLQPVLENAIKHAFRDIDYSGILAIKIEELSGAHALQISVRDNGPGLSPQVQANASQQQLHKSFGLAIVQNRINLLQQDDKETIASFEIIDRKLHDPSTKGLQVDFTVPIKYKVYDYPDHY